MSVELNNFHHFCNLNTKCIQTSFKKVDLLVLSHQWWWTPEIQLCTHLTYVLCANMCKQLWVQPVRVTRDVDSFILGKQRNVYTLYRVLNTAWDQRKQSAWWVEARPAVKVLLPGVAAGHTSATAHKTHLGDTRTTKTLDFLQTVRFLYRKCL